MEVVFASTPSNGFQDIMAADVRVSRGGSIESGTPHKLFSTNAISGTMTPDAQRFLVAVRRQQPTRVTPVTVIENWATPEAQAR